MTNNMQLSKQLFLICISTAFIFSCSEKSSEDQAESADCESWDNIRHIEVYYEEGRFAGWPANNGVWIWDDEILVGFVEADHLTTDGFHTYDRESARNRYARSLDGGETWVIEDA